MGIIILIGAIYMIANGDLFQLIVYLCIVAVCRDKYTDSNRRGGWWK